MIRNMTLGQYYPADSLIHRLDPRVKLLGTLLFVISLFFPRSVPGFVIATLFLVLVTHMSRVPVRLLVRGIRPLLLLIVFTALVNLFSTPGKAVLTAGPFTISREGVILSAFLVIRLIYLLAGSSVMTFTTTPNQLTAGLEKSLGFLTRLYLPVHEFALMMSIALRFIPILTEELDKIMKAQMSRGMDFEEGSLMTRAKKLLPLLVPLFVSAVRRANELGTAMEARCYHGGEGRTRLHPLEYQKVDYLAYLLLTVYIVTMIFVSYLFPLYYY